MAIDFKYSWKYFQNIAKSLASISVCTIAEFLKNLKVRSCITEVIKLGKLILVLPVTNSINEAKQVQAFDDQELTRSNWLNQNNIYIC